MIVGGCLLILMGVYLISQGAKWAQHVVTLGITLAIVGFAYGHEHGRTDANWEKMSWEEKAWIMNLKQPDSPTVSCCGLADQYWCDKTEVRGNAVFCMITDDRDDRDFCSNGSCRPHVPIGTWIEIPPEKMKFGPNDPQKPASNPTGHNIIFMSRAQLVYCFVMATGS